MKAPYLQKECINKLSSFVVAAQENGHEIIISMDANESFASQHSDIPAFLTSKNLVDTITHLHGVEAPQYYLRGRHLIDFVFASETLFPHIRRSRNFWIINSLPSDHVVIWVEFEGTELFQWVTEKLGSIQKNPFTMRDKPELMVFMIKMEAHMLDQSVEWRLGQLQRSIPAGYNTTESQVVKYKRIVRDVNTAIRFGISESSRPNFDSFVSQPSHMQHR